VGNIGRRSLHENCLVFFEMLGAHASNTAEKMQDFDVNSYCDAVWMMQQPTQEDNGVLKRDTMVSDMRVGLVGEGTSCSGRAGLRTRIKIIF